MKVYAMQSGAGGPIKFGVTGGDVVSRRNSLQTGNPSRIEILGEVECEYAEGVESHLHEELEKAGLRVSGEWFRPSIWTVMVANAISVGDLTLASKAACLASGSEEGFKETPSRYGFLQCKCVGERVDHENGVVSFWFEDGDCCDMTGAIRLSRMLCPDVSLIRTFSGDKPDTYYLRSGDSWTAHKGFY